MSDPGMAAGPAVDGLGPDASAGQDRAGNDRAGTGRAGTGRAGTGRAGTGWAARGADRGRAVPGQAGGAAAEGLWSSGRTGGGVEAAGSDHHGRNDGGPGIGRTDAGGADHHGQDDNDAPGGGGDDDRPAADAAAGGGGAGGGGAGNGRPRGGGSGFGRGLLHGGLVGLVALLGLSLLTPLPDRGPEVASAGPAPAMQNGGSQAGGTAAGTDATIPDTATGDSARAPAASSTGGADIPPSVAGIDTAAGGMAPMQPGQIAGDGVPGAGSMPGMGPNVAANSAPGAGSMPNAAGEGAPAVPGQDRPPPVGTLAVLQGPAISTIAPPALSDAAATVAPEPAPVASVPTLERTALAAPSTAPRPEAAPAEANAGAAAPAPGLPVLQPPQDRLPGWWVDGGPIGAPAPEAGDTPAPPPDLAPPQVNPGPALDVTAAAMPVAIAAPQRLPALPGADIQPSPLRGAEAAGIASQPPPELAPDRDVPQTATAALPLPEAGRPLTPAEAPPAAPDPLPQRLSSRVPVSPPKAETSVPVLVDLPQRPVDRTPAITGLVPALPQGGYPAPDLGLPVLPVDLGPQTR